MVSSLLTSATVEELIFQVQERATLPLSPSLSEPGRLVAGRYRIEALLCAGRRDLRKNRAMRKDLLCFIES